MKKDLARNFKLVTVLILLPLCLQSNVAAQSYNLIHQFDADTTLQVQTQLQYSGSVIVDSAGRDENERALPLDVTARINYDQRISSTSTEQPQAIRYIEQADSKINAGKGSTEIELPENKRLVLARLKKQQNDNHLFQIAALENSLTQKEYELLKVPGDPLSFARLFTKENVSVGEKWQPSKDLIADLVSINRVITSDVTMMLKSVEEDQARVYFYGQLRGESDGAITDMNLKGIAILDLTDQLVTSLRMTVDEERRSGQVAPGFEGKVKLDLRLSKTDENPALSKQRMAKVYRGKKVKFNFHLEPENSSFQLQHDTQWRVIASQEDAAVLRYIDDGQLVAQCNLVELPRRPADNPLALNDFKSEINRIISESEGAQIIKSEAKINPAGHSVLHVNVDGLEQGIPFKWLYYHVAANDGRRVTFVFTLEKDAAEYFGSADNNLVASFAFNAVRTADKDNGANQGKPLPKKR